MKEHLSALAGGENLSVNALMSEHTTFKIGGPADYLVTPDSAEALCRVVSFCREEEIPCFVMGNGSNLLVSDAGFRGVIVKIGSGMSDITRDGDTLTAGAGALLSAIAARARDNSLTGFEFAAGIPGTVGGAVIMNAGAYGGEMKQVLKSVKVLNTSGEVETLAGDEMGLGYRTSAFAKRGDVVLEAVMTLSEGDRDEIVAKMDDLRARRREKQPLEMPSAGSTFKRPEGYFAGKLIMDAGLRGYSVGGACVSEKHCGFVVNKGGATARDVRRLMSDVTARVLDEFGVTLVPEVRFLGDFPEESEL